MTGNPLRSTRAVVARLGPWNLFHAIAVVAACAFAYNGARILCDTTGVGEPIFENLVREGCYVEPYAFTQKSKAALIDNLALLLEQGEITLPRPELCPELIDWILLRKEKLPEADFAWYKELAQQPNNLPVMRQFYSQMSMVDDGVGHVLAKLEEKGVLDDTLVIYTADHGLSVGHHGFWGHGEDTWPSNMHRSANNVPLIMSHPDFARPGSEVESLVGTTDIFATILDHTGCETRSPEAISGESLYPLLCGETAELRNEVFMEQEETRAIRTFQWLFMRRFENTHYDFKHELYDLVNDPDERKNLAQLPEYSAVVAELSARVDDFFSRYSNPRWDLWRGGAAKSNSTRPFLWKEVWGDGWAPDY